MTDTTVDEGSTPPMIGTQWKDARPYCAGITTSRDVSFTMAGDGLAILMDNVTINLQQPGNPLSDASVLTFRATLDTPEDKILSTLTGRIDGFVSKTGSSKVTIVLSLGGVVQTYEFGPGEDIDADIHRDLEIAVSPPGSPGVPYQVAGAIFVLAERQSSDDGILVSVDSIDIVAKYS